MQEVIEFLKGFNVQTLLSIAVLNYFFWRNIKGELRAIEGRMDRQGERTDKLYEMFCELQAQTKDAVFEIKMSRTGQR